MSNPFMPMGGFSLYNKEDKKTFDQSSDLSELGKLIKSEEFLKSKKPEYDFGSAVESYLGKSPRQYSLGAETDYSKPSESSEGMSDSTKDAISAGIKGVSTAIGTVASESAKNAQSKAETALKTLKETGSATRAAQSRSATSSQNALAQLIASLRAAPR